MNPLYFLLMAILPLLPLNFTPSGQLTRAQTPFQAPITSSVFSDATVFNTNTCGASAEQTALDSEEQKFVTLINAYRAQNGLGPLTVSNVLTQASAWMASDVASSTQMSHTDSTGRPTQQRYQDCGYMGGGAENLSGNYETAEQTLQAWKESPGHNANMLKANFKTMGIARAKSNVNGKWYWVNDFGDTADNSAPPPQNQPTEPVQNLSPSPAPTQNPEESTRTVPPNTARAKLFIFRDLTVCNTKPIDVATNESVPLQKCLDVKLNDEEVGKLRTEAGASIQRINEWSGGKLSTTLEIIEVPENHKVSYENFGGDSSYTIDPKTLMPIIKPQIDNNTDFVFFTHSNTQKDSSGNAQYKIPLGACELAYPGTEYDFGGANGIWWPYECAGQLAFIHGHAHAMQFSMHYATPNYQDIYFDQVNADGEYPQGLCNEADTDSTKWYPDPHAETSDPDFMHNGKLVCTDYYPHDTGWTEFCKDTQQEGSPSHDWDCSIIWYQHILQSHLPTFSLQMPFIGNHCSNGRIDANETGIDSGGNCAATTTIPTITPAPTSTQEPSITPIETEPTPVVEISPIPTQFPIDPDPISREYWFLGKRGIPVEPIAGINPNVEQRRLWDWKGISEPINQPIFQGEFKRVDQSQQPIQQTPVWYERQFQSIDVPQFRNTGGFMKGFSVQSTESSPLDVTKDSQIDLADYNILLSCLSNKFYCTYSETLDVNRDGLITPMDITVFLEKR